ncbi:MAG: hypothetical protein M5U07_11420 [Xanthobacteraceae bacterium]|nr:hypothetical protein [Xanthobacteraceae bacterium]PWB57464.1 MAG: hypothetical protein C3F17_20545 [Bradyrhizobiaceae bacterium]
MAILMTACPYPHCRANPVPLQVLWNYRQPARKNIVSCCMCPRCELPVSVILIPTADTSTAHEWFLKNEAYGNHDLLRMSRWLIQEVIPTPAIKGAPEHTPTDIAKLNRQARRCMERGENEAARILFGKVLDRSFAALDEDGSGSRVERIGRLVEAGRLPRSLQDCAQELRGLDHDRLDLAPDELMTLAAFAETFLLSAFTVGRKLAAGRSCMDLARSA